MKNISLDEHHFRHITAYLVIRKRTGQAEGCRTLQSLFVIASRLNYVPTQVTRSFTINALLSFAHGAKSYDTVVK